MTVIVESEEQFKELQDGLSNESCIAIPILSTTKESIHYLDSDIALVYFYLIESERKYVLSFAHSEAINLDREELTSLIFKKNIFAYNSKILYNLLDEVYHELIFDIEVIEYLVKNTVKGKREYETQSHSRFNSFCEKSKIIHTNSLVPIVKHIEYCEKIVESFKLVHEEYGEKYESYEPAYNFSFYMMRNLMKLESQKLAVDIEEARKNNNKNFTSDSVRTLYNIFSLTSRPTNHFNGLNYYSLSKKDNERKFIITRYDNSELIEFDYNSYYFRLLGAIIGYDLSEIDDIYVYMFKAIEGRDFENKEERDEFKPKALRLLYTKIIDQYVDKVEFFKIAKIFKEELYKTYMTTGKIETPLGRHIYKKNIEHNDVNENKLLSYYLNACETERNFLVIESIFKFLDEKKSKTKLILYYYDSFLFDVPDDERDSILDNIPAIIQLDSISSIRAKSGKNYAELENLKLGK